MHIASTTERVTRNTSIAVNESITEDTDRRIAYFAAHPGEIDARMLELDREWDIERTLEAQAAGLSIFGVAMGILSHRAWFALPAVVGGFLLQHVVQGWCPPLPVLRGFGVRTQTEIERERYALKALRGDFNQLAPAEDADAADAESLSGHVLQAVK